MFLRKFLAISALLLFAVFISNAAEEEKNITIESKTQTFRFQKAKGNNPVVITEEYSIKYRCNEVRTTILFSEMYNDQETINDVTVYVNDKKAKYIVPKYEYYSVKDIFYSDARVCYFQLPFDQKGATAEVKLEKTYLDPRYFSRVFITEDFFTENKVVKFIIPRWMKSELKDLNFNNNSINRTVEYNSKEDADVYTYTAKALKPFKSEPYALGSSYIYPHVLIMNQEANTDQGTITYFKTIADQYKWCYKLVQEVEDDYSALAAKAKELTATVSGDINKVKTIYNWVQNNVRYIAFEDGIAGFKPAKAIDVLNKKYGDCKGMANLIKGLLKGIGLDARLCWIGTNHIAYDLSTPVLSVHNHMIAALMLNGKTYFLDGTETNIGFNEYAERIAGRQVLIENGDNYILTNVPQVSYTQNSEIEKRTLLLNNNTLTGKATHTYTGESKSTLISKIQGVRKDNIDKALIKYLSEDNADYAITKLNSNHTSLTDSVLNISYDIEFKNGASSFGNEVYIEPDFRKDVAGFTIDTAKRVNDVVLPQKMMMEDETEITLPANYKISSKPTDLNITHPNIEISITYQQQNSKLIYHKRIVIKNTLLKKENFNSWNNALKQLSEKYKEQIVLTK